MCSVREKTTIYLAQRVQSLLLRQIWFQSRFNSERGEFALLSLLLTGHLGVSPLKTKPLHGLAEQEVKAEQEVFATRMAFRVGMEARCPSSMLRSWLGISA